MSIINLIPDDYVRRVIQRRTNLIFAGLFGVTIMVSVAAALVSERSSRHTQQVRDSVEKSYADAARQLQELQDLEARKEAMLAKAESASLLLEKVPRSHLLGIIANAVPEHTSLVRIDLDIKKPPTPTPDPKMIGKFNALAPKAAPLKAPPPFVNVEIVGLAGTDVEVARLISQLARNPMTAAVDLVYSQEKLVNNVPVREFQVHMELKPDADAIQDTTEQSITNGARLVSLGDKGKGVKQ